MAESDSMDSRRVAKSRCARRSLVPRADRDPHREPIVLSPRDTNFRTATCLEEQIGKLAEVVGDLLFSDLYHDPECSCRGGSSRRADHADPETAQCLLAAPAEDGIASATNDLTQAQESSLTDLIESERGRLLLVDAQLGALLALLDDDRGTRRDVYGLSAVDPSLIIVALRRTLGEVLDGLDRIHIGPLIRALTDASRIGSPKATVMESSEHRVPAPRRSASRRPRHRNGEPSHHDSSQARRRGKGRTAKGRRP